MIEREVFFKNLESLRRRIINASSSNGRNPGEIKLLPVTKNWPFHAVRYCQEAGILAVGENRVQEARSKQASIEGMEWELIGHLQTNKINQTIGNFARIQTVDSLKLMNKLQHAAENKDVSLRILIQVNAGADPAKYGFSLESTAAALDFALSCQNLSVEGLMTIAPFSPEDRSVACNCFESLRNLRNDLEETRGHSLPELSMGMSNDLEQAIAAGSTMIRVGSALFGSRN